MSGPHRVSLYSQADFIDSTFADIDNATRRVFVQCYIVKDGLLSTQLMNRLGAAAARGLDVRLLYDPSGSHALSKDRLVGLRRTGVRTRPYGRAAFLGVLRPGIRDHERLALVDDVAYTGGHAWSDEWLPQSRGGGGWRDYNCSIRGPIVEQWAVLFESRWREAPRGWPRPFDTGGSYPDARLVSDGPGHRNLVALAYREAFDRARRRIWLANAYFLPPVAFKRALLDAAERGVDIRIIVPGHSDLAVVQHAFRSEYSSWLERGVSLYEFQGSMFHAKYAVVDDSWCTVGSYNALLTSARATVETNLILSASDVVQTVSRAFLADQDRSSVVSVRAPQSRSLASKVVGRSSRLFLMLAGVLLRSVNWLASRVLSLPRLRSA